MISGLACYLCCVKRQEGVSIMLVMNAGLFISIASLLGPLPSPCEPIVVMSAYSVSYCKREISWHS